MPGASRQTVVKREALTVRRQRSESVPLETADLDLHCADDQRSVDDLLAGRERVTRSAEALRRLKPDEAKALMLKDQGPLPPGDRRVPGLELHEKSTAA